ncbi:hypothetical protein BJ138DRAFT_1120717 [Hygrophoropsis aurantiaca]|uniref:Uncharacterized protein n=1 Tax=Hygrophoropsis aurantiaca TaxID=72124 RepID=A0ACB7ZPN7_9AGAM|nr:hypothetical protein BJ138DRAFT_1120717 [Hygrophoropsis aurantiaca]
MGNSSSRMSDSQVAGFLPATSEAVFSRKRKWEGSSLAPDRGKRFADEKTVLDMGDFKKKITSKAPWLHGSLLPSRKRKAEDDRVDGRPSKRSVSPNYYNNTLILVHPQNIPYIWTLPTELLYAIAGHLSGKALHSLTQVCQRLNDIAGPMFMNECGLQLHVNGTRVTMQGNAYDALMVWRRSPTFQPREVWWCSFRSFDSTRQINQLRNFCSTVSITTPSHSINLSFWSDVDSHLLLSLLKNITCMGSTQISFLGLTSQIPCLAGIDTISQPALPARIQVFRPCASIFFTPPLLHYTVLTMRASSLRILGLERTGLSASQWARLLPQLEAPNLAEIRIDCSCSVTTLGKFLHRHPLVEDISVLYNWPDRNVKLSTKPCDIILPQLRYLSGPARYMEALIRRFKTPPNLYGLSLSFERAGLDGSPFLREIIRCVKMCNTVDHLRIDIPNRSLSAICFRLDGNEQMLHHVMSVAISCREKSALWDTLPRGDILVLISKWLPIFNNIKRLHLSERARQSREGLVAFLRRIGPPLMEIKIGSADIELIDKPA